MENQKDNNKKKKNFSKSNRVTIVKKNTSLHGRDILVCHVYLRTIPK